ncbi:hypothetical protein D3C87_1861510 [compost metagenome]
MPQVFLQIRREIVLADIVEHDHAHAAADIVADQVRNDGILDVGDKADRNRFSRVEVRGCDDASGHGTMARQRFRGWKGRGEVAECARALMFRFVDRDDGPDRMPGNDIVPDDGVMSGGHC